MLWLGLLLAGLDPVRADYPIVSHKFAADPAAMEFNGRLYLYCSNDSDNATNSYQMHSISCYSSDDLKNWTDHGEVLQAPRDVSWASLAWAPSAVSNNGVVYLYFANGASGIGVATNSNPSGTFKDAKGSALINSSTPGAASSTQWYFDPCGFVDDDGQAYLYFGGSAPTNSRVIKLGANLTSVNGSATAPFTTNFFEAAYMHKRNGIYYLTYSTTPSAGMVIYCETNSNPTNGFLPSGTVLPNPPVNVFNNNHAAIVSFKGGWYVAYHNRFVAKANGRSDADAVTHRSLCLDALAYNADGSIQPVVPTTNGLAQIKYLSPYVRVEAETISLQNGLTTEVCAEGGMNVTNIANGDWILVRGVDFTSAGATNFTARIAGAGPGGNIELRLDATNGTLIGSCPVPPTGGWQTWAGVSAAVNNTTARGVHDLFFKFTGTTGTNLFNFNSWQFQSSAVSSAPVSLAKFESESATLGTDWLVSNTVAPAYITIGTDGSGNNPGSSNRIATYTVTFPTPGTYQLYAHLRTGAGTFNDDSMFYGNGFGVKSPTNNADWIFVNGLAAAGWNNPADVVNTSGSLGSGVWKWVNLSVFAPGATFSVTTTNLTQTFQIGARENGLDLDAFVFGLNYYTYTVSALDNGLDGTPPSAGSSVVNWTNLLQRMDGFGGGAVFLDVPDPIPTTHFDTLYNTNGSSLGLTLLRVRISPDTNWTTALTDAQRAVARGGRVLATPWTPPASMKDNNALTNGGALLPSQYANYAAYLNNFAGYLKANGAPLAAISVQNEPDWPATYESCLWSGSQFLSFFRTNAVAITNAPVMMPESLAFNTSYSDATLNDLTAVTNVAYVGGHLYGVGAITDYPLAHTKGKPTWMTEYLINDQTIDSAIITAQQMHDCINTGNMSAYIWWKVMGNANGLLNAAGVAQKRGYVMGQFSRFVRPGFHRVGANYTGAILTTAYRNTNSTSFAIVAINPAGLPLATSFALSNFPAGVSVTPWITSPGLSLSAQSAFVVSNATFSYTLPGLSVVTFVGEANTAPSLVVVSNRTVNPGITISLTNNASDPDLPAQGLTFALLTAPPNASLTPLGPSNAVFTWRPLIAQSASTNVVQVKVSDSGTPSLSATNTFVVTVNPAVTPWLTSIAAGGQVSLQATG
ncbi:MAG: family 43 glycosylhydrolase, partial [Verrucomicrobiota bacterium]